jgi:hypothetical protein
MLVSPLSTKTQLKNWWKKHNSWKIPLLHSLSNDQRGSLTAWIISNTKPYRNRRYTIRLVSYKSTLYVASQTGWTTDIEMDLCNRKRTPKKRFSNPMTPLVNLGSFKCERGTALIDLPNQVSLPAC